jgi:tetratricopeptide (TPR) repeat protein
MSEPSSAPVRPSPQSAIHPRLDSWKSIAEYLGRHVTTVQRWEQDEGLPVHRHQHEKRGSVYAFPAELDAWLLTRSAPVTATAPSHHQKARALASDATHPHARLQTWLVGSAAAAIVLSTLGVIAHARWNRPAPIERTVADSRELTGSSPGHSSLARDRQAARHTKSREAWDAYLRARFFWNRRTHSDMSRAIEWYERAITEDATFAMGYAGLADVYASLGPANMPISELIARGTKAAEKAIELDPSLGEPLAALGKLRAYAWDWRGAETYYRQAIERTPTYAPARYWFGLFLANQGRCDEAFEEATEAERLDPISLPGNMVVSSIELRCRRVDQAITRSRVILDFDPNYAASYELLARAYLAKGEIDQALAMVDHAVEKSQGRATVLAMRAFVYAAAGRTADAAAIASDLEARHKRDKVLASAWSAAIAQAGLHRDEAALDWLEHSYSDREEWLEALAVDERLTRLHGNPRFQQLLLRLGLRREPRNLAMTVEQPRVAER